MRYHMHLLEWPKSGTLITSNTGGDVEPQEHSYIACWRAKSCSHYEILWWRLIKLHTLLPYNTANTPWYFPTKAENIYLHKHLHTDLCSRFIHNCQNLEATKLSFRRRVAKLWHIRQWTVIECQEDIIYKTIKRQGGTLNAYY